MTNKLGTIKNPLTIIAIFAGIAEVSGTAILPLISDQNQLIFIYFLISFPLLLIVLFFITLNFNNKVLYAPSDYRDESNYISVNKYDPSNQKTIVFEVPEQKALDEEVKNLKEKREVLQSRLQVLRNKIEGEQRKKSKEPEYIETYGIEFMVSNFPNVEKFVKNMEIKNIIFEVFESFGRTGKIASPEDHRAIWLGEDVSLEAAKFSILKAKEYFPHLKYIWVSNTDNNGENKRIYIGGATSSAIDKFKLQPISEDNFNKIQSFTSKIELHKFIKGLS